MRVIQTTDEQELHALAAQLAEAKRVAMITGAGISTSCGIPDFRSASTGLFASLKEKNPDLKISSGKDLFHTNLFQREDTTRAFYQMCAEMKRMANEADPSDFHLLMKDLDDAGKLFRIYTQNIDSLEAKAGLTFGLGEWRERERLVKKRQNKRKGMSMKAKGKQRAVDETVIDPLLQPGQSAEAASSSSSPLQLNGEGEQRQQDQDESNEQEQDEEGEGDDEELGMPSSSQQSINNQYPEIQSSQSPPPDSLLFAGQHSFVFNNGSTIDSARDSTDTPFQIDSPPPLQPFEFTQSTAQADIEIATEVSSLSMSLSPSAASQNLPLSPQQVQEERKPTTPVLPISTWEEFEQVYVSPTREALPLPSITQSSTSSATTPLGTRSDETMIVPNSQESKEAEGQDITQADVSLCNSSVLTSLTDLSNATLSEILHMPFGSQESSVDESAQADSSIAELPRPKKEEEPVEKEITIQRFLTVPSVIPLHGTLDEMHCPKCNHIEQLDDHISVLASGFSIYCPRCLTQDTSRTALGERSRGVGVLKVSVVLYGEEHKQASRVGEIAEKDLLKAARPDVLIVAGTTLRIPGVRKMVKELAKVIKQQIEEPILDSEGNPTGEYIKKDDPSKQVIYVNNDAPVPEKTWSEVFDTFVQGDIQTFAAAMRQELYTLRNPPPPISAAEKKKAAMAAAAAAAAAEAALALPEPVQGDEVQPLPEQSYLTDVLNMNKAVSEAMSQRKEDGVKPDLVFSSTISSGIETTTSTNAEAAAISDANAPAVGKVKKVRVKKDTGNSEHAKATKVPKAVKVPKEKKVKVVDKKTIAGAKTGKAKALAAKAPGSQETAKRAPSAGPAVKAKPKRPPKKSVAQFIREQKLLLALSAPSFTPSQPAVKAPKEKVKPGWKGYALITIDEDNAKNVDEQWNPPLVEGTRRRRTSTLAQMSQSWNLNSSSSSQASARPLTSDSAMDPHCSSSSIIPASASSSQASISATSAQQLLLANALPMEFSPSKSSLGWLCSSQQPSTASTPPSLDSDLGTISDNEEIRSVRGSDDGAVSSAPIQISSSSYSSTTSQVDEQESPFNKPPCSSSSELMGPSSTTMVVQDSQSGLDDTSLRTGTSPPLEATVLLQQHQQQGQMSPPVSLKRSHPGNTLLSFGSHKVVKHASSSQAGVSRSKKVKVDA